MSTLKVNNLQVGQDGTAANNYTLYQPASPDGTVRLGYGVAGSVTDILTLKNSRLGIGETNPDQLIHINKASGTTLFKASTQANSTIGLEIEKTGSTTQSWRIVDGQTINGALEFYDATNTTTRMIIRNGNIGINQSNPATGLDIKSTKNGDGLTITKGSNVSTFLGHNGSGDEGLLLLKEGGTTRVQLYAETNQNSYINSGNLGIGTTSPGALLHLESTAANAAKLRIGFDSPRYYDIYRGSTTNSGYLNFYGSQSTFVGYTFGGVDGEWMRITASGRVGIGHADPATKLVVAASDSGHADMRFQNSTTGYATNNGFWVGLNSNEKALLYNYHDSDMFFATKDTGRMTITSDGAVNIGSGNDASSMSQFGSNTDGLTIDDVGVSNTGIKLSHGSSNTYLVQAGNNNAYLSHYGSGQMIFGVGSTGQEAFRINASRVARFQNATGDLKVASTTSNDGGKIFLQEGNTDAWSLEAQRANGSFFIRDEYNNKERFSILNNGNIGVGLEITLRENTTDAFSLHSNGANGYFRLIDEYDNVELMRFHGDGALSINTTNLTNYTQTSNSGNTNNAGGAAGNWSWRRDTGAVIQATDADSGWALMYLNKYEWNSGDDNRWISFYLNGQVRDTINWNGTNIIYGQGSDYRVKENIREFTNGIDKVKQLKVHLYDYIDPDRGTDHIGFIAHELQEIIPEAVSGEKDGMRKEEDTGNDVIDIQMVDYGKLTPVLTAALQEALAKIETLETRIAALES